MISIERHKYSHTHSGPIALSGPLKWSVWWTWIKTMRISLYN